MNLLGSVTSFNKYKVLNKARFFDYIDLIKTSKIPAIKLITSVYIDA